MIMESLRSLDRLAGRTVLVTGASGFIGSHLCCRLQRGGAEVHAISRLKHAPDYDGCRWWRGDLAEIQTARKLISRIKPEVIFHLGGYVDGGRDLAMVAPTFLSNLAATVNLLTVTAEIGCQRIILAGSQEEPVAGDPEAVPCSPYAVAKWAGNAYARMFHALYQLPVVILRIFMVYGPAQRDERKLIPYVILSLLRGEVPRLTAGQRPVDWIYVDDVVEAFVAAALTADVEGGTFDVGSGDLVTIRSVLERIAQHIDPHIELNFGTLPDRALEQVRVARIAGTETVLGWKPAISLSEGLSRTVNWYRQGRQAGSWEPVQTRPCCLAGESGAGPRRDRKHPPLIAN
jgi:nucleoside-diphosphate-sugar epimerase